MPDDPSHDEGFDHPGSAPLRLDKSQPSVVQRAAPGTHPEVGKCADLHLEQNRTLVAVLHDLNHACRYATHLIAMKAGHVVAVGKPAEIVTAELVEQVFGLACRIIDDPETGTPLIIPLAKKALRAADLFHPDAPPAVPTT